MRNKLRTPFWQAAYRSLPEVVRRRHLADIERAERWEFFLDGAVETYSRAKGAVSRLLNTAAKAHSH